MREEPKTKCSEAGFLHSWKDITSNIMYPTYPPQYPDRQEQCINCGLVRNHRKKTELWFEYVQGELPNYTDITITGLTDGAGGTTKSSGAFNPLN